MGQPRLTSYERLDGAEVRAVLTYLGERIDTYLPRHPGLRTAVDVCGTLVDSLLERGRRAPAQRAALMWSSRALIVVVLAVVLVATGFALRDAIASAGSLASFEWLPLVESLINDLVFAGIAIWFLLSVADRVVRNDLIRRLHRLRSLAHVVDMHQMSKDPAALLPDTELGTVAGDDVISPRTMSVRDYALYLDYCSELLSLISKAAALCAEESTDALVLDTVSEIEILTTGMSRKIWQKISLLQTAERSQQPRP
jgi:HAMP domain-containing protein